MIEPHRYDSGVYHDTEPGDAVGCCNEWRGHAIHNVPCGLCGTVHSVYMPCYKPTHRRDL